jgi:hypothetical protein
VRPPPYLGYLIFLIFVHLSINYYCNIGKSNSLAAFESSNGPSVQSNAQLNSPKSATSNNSPCEELSGFACPNDFKQSGKQDYLCLFVV